MVEEEEMEGGGQPREEGREGRKGGGGWEGGRGRETNREGGGSQTKGRPGWWSDDEGHGHVRKRGGHERP